MEEDKKMSLEDAVQMASWTHNTNVNVTGFQPMQLMTGKSVVLPGLTTGNMATESVSDDEMVRSMMERHYLMMKEFREAEFSKKLGKVLRTRKKGYEDVKLNEGDLVFYQYEGKKAWIGPERVFAIKGIDVFVFANGNIRKIPRCNVQLCEKFEEEEKKEENDKKVKFGEDKDEETKRTTRSMTEAKKKEIRNEVISTFWMQKENSECYDDITIYTVEVPVREHKNLK